MNWSLREPSSRRFHVGFWILLASLRVDLGRSGLEGNYFGCFGVNGLIGLDLGISRFWLSLSGILKETYCIIVGDLRGLGRSLWFNQIWTSRESWKDFRFQRIKFLPGKITDPFLIFLDVLGNGGFDIFADLLWISVRGNLMGFLFQHQFRGLQATSFIILGVHWVHTKPHCWRPRLVGQFRSHDLSFGWLCNSEQPKQSFGCVFGFRITGVCFPWRIGVRRNRIEEYSSPFMQQSEEVTIKESEFTLSNGDDGDLKLLISGVLCSLFYGNFRLEWLMVVVWSNPSLVSLGFRLTRSRYHHHLRSKIKGLSERPTHAFLQRSDGESLWVLLVLIGLRFEVLLDDGVFVVFSLDLEFFIGQIPLGVRNWSSIWTYAHCNYPFLSANRGFGSNLASFSWQLWDLWHSHKPWFLSLSLSSCLFGFWVQINLHFGFPFVITLFSFGCNGALEVKFNKEFSVALKSLILKGHEQSEFKDNLSSLRMEKMELSGEQPLQSRGHI